MNVIKTALTDFNIPIQKVVNLGADGAAVMSSDLNGVNGLMKQLNPYCIYVHCVCHRLNLAVSQACKNNDTMKTLSTIVGTVYNFVQQCSTRLQKSKTLRRSSTLTLENSNPCLILDG